MGLLQDRYGFMKIVLHLSFDPVQRERRFEISGCMAFRGGVRRFVAIIGAHALRTGYPFILSYISPNCMVSALNALSTCGSK